MRSSSNIFANVAIVAVAAVLVVSMLIEAPASGRHERYPGRLASELCVSQEAFATGAFLPGEESRLQEWDLQVQSLHTLHVALMEDQLRIAREVAGAGAGLRLASRLRSEHTGEYVAWRRVEANEIKLRLRMKLAEFQSDRDVMSERYVADSVWLRRINAIVDAAKSRMDATPSEVETGRMLVADPIGSMLDAIQCQTEIFLESCAARELLIREQLREIRTRLADLRCNPAMVFSSPEGLIHL